MEMLSDVILTPDEWTPANGLVTAAQKVNRAKVASVFGEDIEVSRLVIQVDGS